MLIKYISQIVLSLIAVSCFAFYFNVPKKVLPSCAISGTIGWIFYTIFMDLNLYYLGFLLGAFGIGLVGGFYARKYKMPTTVFVLAGIVPIVPGMNLYLTMYNVIMGDYSQAFREALKASLIAGCISVGISLAVYVIETISSNKVKKKIPLK